MLGSGPEIFLVVSLVSGDVKAIQLLLTTLLLLLQFLLLAIL